MKIIGIIPARYASTRFPGKPLALIAGQTLIQRVVQRCQQAKALAEVIVATDDERIAAEARKYCRVEMTRADHPSGSDRIAESARAGKVAWLAHAADAAEDGSRKLDQAWRVGQEAEGTGLRGVTLPLDRAALSVALGRDNVVHLALTDAKAAERVSAALQRLLHFLGRADTTGMEMTKQMAPGAPAAATTD